MGTRLFFVLVALIMAVGGTLRGDAPSSTRSPSATRQSSSQLPAGRHARPTSAGGAFSQPTPQVPQTPRAPQGGSRAPDITCTATAVPCPAPFAPRSAAASGTAPTLPLNVPRAEIEALMTSSGSAAEVRDAVARK